MQTPRTLLLVEDDDGDAFLVRELLADQVPAVAITRAATLSDAHVELAVAQPDVILLDLGLPDADGVGIVADVVTAAPRSAVLVLTGLGDEHRGAAAVAAGAQDYLVKGQVDGGALMRAMRYAVERKQVDESQRLLLASAVRAEENARLERGLLPQPHVRGDDLVLTARYRPGRHQSLIGGDFYDLVEDHDGRLHVIVGDVSGHGPDAAALGVLLRSGWRALVLAGTAHDRVLGLLSELITLERQDDETFATAVYLVVSPDRAEAEFYNAGHPRPLRLAGEVASPWPDKHGPLLGIPGLDSWKSIGMPAGELWPLMLYTDGLVEGHAGPDRLGEDGLCALLATELAADADPLTVPDRIIDRVEELNGGPLTDDVALVVLDLRTGA